MTVAPAPGAEASTISHLAAPAASIDLDDETARCRQRCVWCGSMLLDADVPAEQAEEAGFEAGAMVRHDLDSGVWFPIPFDEEADEVPADSCMMLPLELTGSVGKPASYTGG